MTPLALLGRLQAAGADLVLDGGALRLRSTAPIDADLLAEARRHKGDLLAELQAESKGDADERDAIMTIDGGPTPKTWSRPHHGQPTPDLVKRLAAALAVDRPWQRSTGPEGMTYFTGRALRLLERLDPLGQGLLVQHEEAQAARWRTPVVASAGSPAIRPFHVVPTLHNPKPKELPNEQR